MGRAVFSGTYRLSSRVRGFRGFLGGDDRGEKNLNCKPWQLESVSSFAPAPTLKVDGKEGCDPGDR